MPAKVAIITSAGKGIGAAIASELAASGYRVSLLSSSGGALELAQEVDGIGMTGSVTEPSDLGKLVNLTMEKYGRVDAVVNNTGHPPKGELLEISDGDWHLGLDLLILNVVRMARLVTPIFVKQGGGGVEEIAKTVRFLLSEDAGYITGQNIRADGGITHSA